MICLFGSITLADTTVKLKKSIVTATSGSEKNIVDAPASVGVITQEELEKKPYRDLGEAIKEIPGVSLEETNNKLGASAISIRGMPAAYTLFLIDGLRQNPSGDVATANLGVGVYNTFMPPLSVIDRIEVIRGPMSTLYGSDALGGVVNIITKPITKQWTGSFQSQAILPESSKFGNTYQNSLYTAGPLSKTLGLTIRARQFTKKGSSKLKNDLGQEVDSFFGAQNIAYNVGGRLAYTPNEKNMLFADIDYTKSTYDNRTGQITTAPGVGKWVGMNKLMTSLVHDGTYDFGVWKNSLQFMQTESTGRRVMGRADLPNFGKNRDITSNDVIADSRLMLPLGDYNILNIGAEYLFENYHDLAGTPSNHNRNTFALFAEDEWNIFDPLTLTLGTRYNYNDKFGSNVSPRAYLVYELINGWALKGGVATGYKAPYSNQLIDAVYGYVRAGQVVLLGNPDLKAESSVSYEVGTVFDNDYIDFSLMLFLSNFKDKIEFRSVSKIQGSAGYNQTCALYGVSDTCNLNYNADTAYTQGVEATFGVKPFYGVGFDVSYAFIDSEITSGMNKGLPLSTTAKHNLFTKLSYSYAKFDTYLQTHYKQGILATDALTNDKIQKVLGGIYYKPSLQLNLGVGYKLTDMIRLNGGIYNILDFNFADFRYYDGGRRGSNVNIYGPVIQEGRRYWVNVALEF